MNVDLSALEVTHFGGQVNFDPAQHLLIGLYFSAHWCPPSRLFTPKLTGLYSLINTNNKRLEIISISFDRDVSCWESYFEEMPWLAIPFANEELRVSLAQQLKVVNPFKLIILTPTGKVLTFKGIDDLKEKGAEAFDYWLLTSDSMSIFKTPPCCKNGHLMTYADHKETEKCQTCCCNIVIGWKCTECQILLCQSCEEWICSSEPQESIAKCLNLHNLRLTQGLNEFYMKRFLHDRYSCRTCNIMQAGESFHCRSCLFDVCLTCFKVIEESPGGKKTFCASEHELQWTSNLCMILQQKFKFCKYRCEECGESFIGGGAFACVECEYYQCLKCFKKYQSE